MSRRPPRPSFEARIAWWVFAAGLPGSVTALWFLWTADVSLKVRWTLTLLILGALTAAGAPLVRGIPYNFNLLDLQAKGLPSVDYELKIIAKSDRSTWDAAFIVPDPARRGCASRPGSA